MAANSPVTAKTAEPEGFVFVLPATATSSTVQLVQSQLSGVVVYNLCIVPDNVKPDLPLPPSVRSSGAPGELLQQHGLQISKCNGLNGQNRTKEEMITTTTEGASNQQESSRIASRIDLPAIMQLAGAGVPMNQIAGLLRENNEQEDDVVYVNPKQYHRIMVRRVARAKLEASGRIPKERKAYLHESRHRHTLNRQRGAGGRFLSGEGDGKVDAAQSTSQVSKEQER